MVEGSKSRTIGRQQLTTIFTHFLSTALKNWFVATLNYILQQGSCISVDHSYFIYVHIC